MINIVEAESLARVHTHTHTSILCLNNNVVLKKATFNNNAINNDICYIIEQVKIDNKNRVEFYLYIK